MGMTDDGMRRDLEVPVGGRWEDVQGRTYWDPAPPGFPLEDAYAAQECVRAYWRAIGLQDDVALETLMYGPSRARLRPGPLGPQLLEATGLTQAQAATMGLVDNVRVLPDSHWCFLGWPATKFEVIDSPTMKQAWLVVAVWGDGRWQVWGMVDPGEARSAVVVRLPIQVDWSSAARA